MGNTYELTKKQLFFVDNIKAFVEKQLKPLAEKTDRSGVFPREAFQKLAGNHLLGLIVPREEGGEEAGFHDLCLVLEGIARVCPTSALLCAVQNLGAWHIRKWGTAEQRKKYLAKIMNGSCVVGFIIPEPASFNVLETSLSFTKSTKDGFAISGPEVHAVNGDEADVILVHARGEASSDSFFLVDKGVQGFNAARIEGLTGAEARYTPKVKFENCLVPIESLLGIEGGAEEIGATLVAHDCCLTAARALGIAQGALEFSLHYSQEREQFGRPISKFQAIQMKLGDIGSQVEAARHLVYKAAASLDQKSANAAMLAAMAKYFASNAAMRVAKDSLQISGGYGLMKDYPVEKMMRNAQLTQIAQGSSHNQQLRIAGFLLKQGV
jgi:alkylation response protein AidB-like acyl-CoA dehydrogenase